MSLKHNNFGEAIRINENKPGSKQNKYFGKTNDAKQILRDMMTSHIPAEITMAKKQVF